MKFKVCQKINVYGMPGPTTGGWSGDIVTINGDRLEVRADYNGQTYSGIHPKQTRLLKKKERRRVWIYGGNLKELHETGSFKDLVRKRKPDYSNDAWIEFIEVKSTK